MSFERDKMLSNNPNIVIVFIKSNNISLNDPIVVQGGFQCCTNIFEAIELLMSHFETRVIIIGSKYDFEYLNSHR